MVFILIYSILTTLSFRTKLGVFFNDIFVELNTKEGPLLKTRHNKMPASDEFWPWENTTPYLQVSFDLQYRTKSGKMKNKKKLIKL